MAGIPLPRAARALLASAAVLHVATLDKDIGPQVHGTARVTKGRAADILQRLAYTYLGPDVAFPGMPAPPHAYISGITAERLGGVGPWNPPHRRT